MGIIITRGDAIVLFSLSLSLSLRFDIQNK
jgi:hypothetical protein